MTWKQLYHSLLKPRRHQGYPQELLVLAVKGQKLPTKALCVTPQRECSFALQFEKPLAKHSVKSITRSRCAGQFANGRDPRGLSSTREIGSWHGEKKSARTLFGQSWETNCFGRRLCMPDLSPQWRKFDVLTKSNTSLEQDLENLRSGNTRYVDLPPVPLPFSRPENSGQGTSRHLRTPKKIPFQFSLKASQSR